MNRIEKKDTEFIGEKVSVAKDVQFEIPDEEYYQSLIDGKVEYISSTDDLAIMSFRYDGDLTVLNFSEKKIKENDKIMVVGHPEGNRYKDTYGYIKSLLERVEFKNPKGKQSVIKHDAYMKQGNSGGVALNKDNKIVGINIGGTFNIFGYYDEGYMIPYDIILNNISNWRSYS